ncbi:H-2 class II histocompatibility antigen, E-S beta chain-like isoform X1 [Carcharodon carcharias]|uniref:H-2 class II histocompatibility antigen, E-S beta chain-like isoform X1 n=1 Tax=Carcharodon carcharias TaxID=13397 RepID=UPI001B7F023A|nr:H-2 class II histocompatibility antigen, E-S beta chain-like isoform X1 [Carcharodon carcharias]
MSISGAADSRPLWIRISLIVWSLIIFNGERESGAGAHTYNRIVGCEFNSTGTWTYHDQYVYDHELIVYFDFAQKKFIAVKDWMKSNVDRWNREIAAATYQAAIGMCQNNIDIDEREVLPRRVKPIVTVQPKVSHHSGQSALLSCHITGFYPPEIEVTWLKNGAEIPNGVVNTVLLSDGDWTYQVLDLLQYHPVSGDKYTCHVNHISLSEPSSTDWEVQSTPESEKLKIIVGALGFGIGLIILLAGVIMRLKNAKAILDSSNPGPRLMGPAVS